MQHVLLRLRVQPYMHEHIWDTILQKAGWKCCVRLGHMRLARELMPESQKAMDLAVDDGDIDLLSRLIKCNLGIPDMDRAAKAGQFKMLRHLDWLNMSDRCICTGSKQMLDICEYL